MSDQKALTDGTGGLGRVDEDLALPPGARPISSGWMSGLMGRLTARTQRRGSLGFNDGGLSTPPARLGSQDEHWEGWEEGRGLAKQRNDSYNFLSSTPGGDGDQYHFKQRFRRNNSESQDMSSLVGGDWEEETHTTSTLTDLPGGPTALPTLQEGVVINLSPPKEENTMYAQADPLRGVVTVRDPPSREERGVGVLKEEEESQREGSIFLIDLEETKCNDGKTQLKPKSKKFSASSLLGSKITQNWFFRKEDDLDNLVDETMEVEEEERSRKESSKSNSSTSSSDSNQSSSGGRGSVMRKLKSLTERNNAGWREINFGAPQGT